MDPQEFWSNEEIAHLKAKAEEAVVARARGWELTGTQNLNLAMWTAFQQGRMYECREARRQEQQAVAKTWKKFETTLRVLGGRAGMSADECDALVKDFEEYCDKQWLDGHSEGYDTGITSSEQGRG